MLYPCLVFNPQPAFNPSVPDAHMKNIFFTHSPIRSQIKVLIADFYFLHPGH